MFSLHFRMFLLVIVLFAIVYAVVMLISAAIGITSLAFYVIFTCIIVFLQFMLGPSIVNALMRVRYVSEREAPELHRIVKEISLQAGIKKPKVGIAEVYIPNAFAFGRSISDGRVCVTRGLLRLLNKDELKSVIGHEISHIKNRDFITITFLSVIPLILYRIAWHLLFFGSYSRRREGAPALAIVGLISFLFYFITNLLVLYASRIREYFADLGSVRLGNPAHNLASALYKLVYGNAKVDKETLKEVEGVKAFFLNDPSKALTEIRELRELDLDRSGTIDQDELLALRQKKVKLSFADKLMELLTTHPNMLKRIKQLAKYENI